MHPDDEADDLGNILSEEEEARLSAILGPGQRKEPRPPKPTPAAPTGPGPEQRPRRPAEAPIQEEAPAAATPYYLRVLAGPDRGKRLALPARGAVRVGRAPDVDARLDDGRVSRYHCRVTIEPGRVTVLDLGSKTGTFVNSQRIAAETQLLTGDLLALGDTQLQLTSAVLDDTSDCTPVVKTPAAPPAAGTSKRPPASAGPGVSLLVGPDSSAHALASLANTTVSYFSLGPVLGVGQHGTVFRALDTRDRSPVALKVFVPEFSRREEDVQRFIRAARTIMPLRYLHVVDFYNAGRFGGSCWVSMELIEGPSVAWYVQQAAVNQVDWRVALHVLRDVTRALVLLHGKRVLHRNLTPENLMVCAANGLVKVGDLITAKAQEGAFSLNVTLPGHLVGDLRYLAPERTYEDPSAGDERSDLYSLGAVVYAVLAGRPPLEGKHRTDAIDRIRRTVPTPLRQLEPAVPPALEAVVMRLLAKEPEHRFGDAKALLRHLVDQKLMD